jgi:predicted SAM-dependent methyltransferase
MIFTRNSFNSYILRLLHKIEREVIKSSGGFKYSCSICGKRIASFERLPDYYFEMFDKHQYIHSLFYSESLNYLKYSCPYCGSSDRNRLYALYFKKRFSDLAGFKNKLGFLDIAPDKNLSEWVKKFDFIQYRSVDLFMEDADDKADITDLKIYGNDKFDIILCSHVLEHIVEDRKALSEIYRILKPGGYGIIMVPIQLNLQEDLYDPSWTTEAERWKYYGQNDHVRMYSKKGFINKMVDTGFKVNQLGIDYFGEKVFEETGLKSSTVLYVVEK